MSNSFLPNCSYSIRLLDKLTLLDAKNILDFPMIKKAISFAKKYHDRQFRKSGEPYYTHPLEVAYMISDYNLKTDVIVTSILHDVVEDSEATAGMILDEFSWRIAEMVDMLTRDRPDGSVLSVEEIIISAVEKNDKEVLLIKLIDRLHNMMTIGSKKPEKQKKTANETLEKMISCSADIKIHKELVLLAAKIVKPTSCSALNKIYSKTPIYINSRLPSLN